jgi:hypothetical protein
MPGVKILITAGRDDGQSLVTVNVNPIRTMTGFQRLENQRGGGTDCGEAVGCHSMPAGAFSPILYRSSSLERNTNSRGWRLLCRFVCKKGNNPIV